MISFCITGVIDGGYIVRKMRIVSTELIADDIVFAGTMHLCFSYIGKALRNPDD